MCEINDFQITSLLGVSIRLGLFISLLMRIELIVGTLFLQQLFVRSLLDNAALADD